MWADLQESEKNEKKGLFRHEKTASDVKKDDYLTERKQNISVFVRKSKSSLEKNWLITNF